MEDKSRYKIPSKIATERTVSANLLFLVLAATSVSACRNARTILVRFLFTTDDSPSIRPLPPPVRQGAGMQIVRPKGSQFGFRAVELDHILPDVVEVAEYWKGPNYRTDVDAHQYWTMLFMAEGTLRIGSSGFSPIQIAFTEESKQGEQASKANSTNNGVRPPSGGARGQLSYQSEPRVYELPPVKLPQKLTN